MKLQLKRSSVLDSGSAKAPTAGQMEYGELAVNYNTADVQLFIKDSDNNVVSVTALYAPLASPAFTGTVTGPTINASTALQIGGVAITSTAAELNYSDGVTSNIQTQIDTKAPKASPAFTGDATLAGDLTINTDALFVDASAKKVGIGTTSPSTYGTLAVSGTGSIINLTASSGTGALGFWESTSSRFFLASLGGSDGLAFIDANGSSERMRIDSSGNVGIGNIAPAAKLHLESTSEQLRITYTSIASYRHEVHSNGDYSINNDGNERMRIDSSGNVGIGTTSPSDKLEIEGDNGGYSFRVDAETTPVTIRSEDNTGSAFGAIRFTAGNASTESERMRIDSSGNVGIGTTSPTGFGPSLHVAGTNPAFILQDTATAVDYLGCNITSGAATTWFDDGAHYAIGTASGVAGNGYIERMRIDSSGSLLIGPSGAPATTITATGEITVDSGSGAGDGQMLLNVNNPTYTQGINLNPNNVGGSTIAVYSSGSSSQKCYVVYDGTDNSPEHVVIKGDGSATFAGVCDATCFTGDVDVSYGHKERTTEGDINVPYNTWTTIDTDYGWDLPGAGTYKLSAFLRVKVWDVDGYVNARASGSAGNSNAMMLFESNDGDGEYNASATPFWVYTATGADAVKCQFNTNNNTTGTSIQNDANGRNSFYWERIG